MLIILRRICLQPHYNPQWAVCPLTAHKLSLGIRRYQTPLLDTSQQGLLWTRISAGCVSTHNDILIRLNPITTDYHCNCMMTYCPILDLNQHVPMYNTETNPYMVWNFSIQTSQYNNIHIFSIKYFTQLLKYIYPQVVVIKYMKTVVSNSSFKTRTSCICSGVRKWNFTAICSSYNAAFFQKFLDGVLWVA